jgi:arylformamidase
MDRLDPAWLDRQYNNRARIPEHAQIFDRWAKASALAQDGMSRRLDIAYGDRPGETLDVYPTTVADAPVLVFIHGGYWRSLDKRDLAFVAPAFVHAGAMVVLPNYGLCPTVGIDEIVLQTVRAMAWTWRHAALYGGDPGRIVVAGHSAGGHLAAMMLSCDWNAVAPDLPCDLVRRAMSISGLYDLEPLRHAPFLQDDLRLTPDVVRRASPAYLPPPRGILYAVAGADESEEFVRQNELIRTCWGREVVPVCETIPGTHHLDIVHDLADADKRLHRLLRSLLERPA